MREDGNIELGLEANWCIFNDNESQKSLILETDLPGSESMSRNGKVGVQFGHISYDFKNALESLKSENPTFIEVPDIQLYKGVYEHNLENNKLNQIVRQKAIALDKQLNTNLRPVVLKSSTSKEAYFANFDRLQFHIARGDIYEINYCVEWFAKGVFINPFKVYAALNELTKAPFSCLYKSEDIFLICGSPERFLSRKANKLISQPIKGTAKRGFSDAMDMEAKNRLAKDLKERAENVMTTDVVRNDFSRIAKEKSVKVEELAQPYTYKTVHHLVSTVACELEPNMGLERILKATFPMPSMTGAPKISAMKIIEEVENFKRGLYAGSVGFLRPNGDFEFNVVIRSIIYNHKQGCLSVPVGSAITAKSDPEKEWEECLIKKEAMENALK